MLNSVWADLDAFEEAARLGSRLERMINQIDQREAMDAGPPARLVDMGESLRLELDLPGFKRQDVTLTLDKGLVTVAAEVKVEVPEGYTPQLRERRSHRFSRSYRVPARLDVQKASATMKHGVLTVMLPKSADHQPRRIEVKAS